MSDEPDIARARAPAGATYGSPEIYQRQLDVFAKSWLYAGHLGELGEGRMVRPVALGPGSLDEPILLVRDGGELRGLSNVCTHRGNLLVQAPCAASALRCRYHGRRFDLAGRLLGAPEMEGSDGFPDAGDDLPRVAVETFGPLLFARLQGEAPFGPLVDFVRARIGFVPLDALRFEPARSRSYEVAAHWALYVDNYLEGFHIPFVHPELAKALDYGSYETELWPGGVLQLGVAEAGTPAFVLPPGHPDQGRPVAAYYFWLFPGTMLNFYPWGVSVNVVHPLGPERTRVDFLSFVHDASLLGEGAGGDLDRVEQEDEAVVEAVQRGVRSRLYRGGRYSPRREGGVFHFHRLLAEAMV